MELRGVSLGQGETLDLVVREWEAVAVVALAGNALDELEDIAVGLRRLPPGQVLLLGKALASYPAAELYGSVLGYLPTDREARALSLRSSALDNCIAKRVPGYSARQFAFRAAPKRDAQALMTGYGIRGTLCGPAESLSGGNRQRLVVARELSSVPKLVVAANPCQGLDPAGRARVLGRLAELRDAGAAVLLLTQDPEDASQLGDRVFALYRGRLTPLSGDEVKAGKLSSVLTGVLA